jgi:hypothetical protein
MLAAVLYGYETRFLVRLRTGYLGIKDRRLERTASSSPHFAPFTKPDRKTQRMRWAGHVARMVETRYRYTILVRKPRGRRPVGRPRRRWNDNIKMGVGEIGIRVSGGWLRTGPGCCLLFLILLHDSASVCNILTLVYNVSQITPLEV